MARYLRLYLYFLRFSFSKAFEFRVDFWFRVVMDAFYYAVNIGFYRVLYVHTDLLAGWDERQVMVFVGAYLVVDALNMTVFANNLWWLPIHVNKGDLDYYLVRPVSPFFFLTLREFAANSFVNLLLALGVLVWALSRLPVWPGPGELAVFAFMLVNGTVLYGLVHLLMLLPVFWIHSGRGLGSVFFLLTRAMERPDAIFHGWVRRILITVLPFGLMASFPTRAVLDEPTWSIVGHAVVVTVIVFAVTLWVWSRALRAYSSASS